MIDRLGKLTENQLLELKKNLDNPFENELIDESDKEFFVSKLSVWNSAYPLTMAEIKLVSERINMRKDDLIQALSIPASPKIILNHLKKHVKGQDKMLEDLSVMSYMFLLKSGRGIQKAEILADNLPLSNILIVGPSGSGKTFSVRTLANYLNMNYFHIDSSLFVTAGIQGTTIEDKLTELYLVAGSKEKFENSILHFDEIDKKCAYARGNDFTHYTVTVQSQLLGLIDNDTVSIQLSSRGGSDSITVSTKKMWFVFSGAFSGIENIIAQRLNTANRRLIGFSAGKVSQESKEEINLLSQITASDLIQYGLMPEFIGRIGRISTLARLNKKTIKEILGNSESSVLKEYINYFKLHDITMRFEDDALDCLAEKIVCTGLGARSISKCLNDILYPMMFRVDEAFPNNELTINRECIEQFFNQ